MRMARVPHRLDAQVRQGTMRFGSTAKVLAECKLKYYRVSECRALAEVDKQRLTL